MDGNSVERPGLVPCAGVFFALDQWWPGVARGIILPILRIFA
jgi:hypothetical protein